MILSIILFVIGFYLLIKGADWLVDGASSVAKKYNISDLVIGLTVVSFGTSAPELVINILASFSGSSEIAIGNVLGSNIANIFLILGISALICNLPLKKSTVFSEIPFTLIAIFLVGFLANTHLFSSETNLQITEYEGLMLLVFFILFMGYIYILSKDDKDVFDEIEEVLTIKKSAIYIAAGIFAMFFGGKWVVEGAIEFATYFGLTESFIGLTIISLGTSLPELATSITAAKKGNADIAVGNIVGSNIFNLLWILGISAFIKNLQFTEINNIDIVVTGFASVVLLLSMTYGKKYNIGRADGVLYIILYVAYIFMIYQR